MNLEWMLSDLVFQRSIMWFGEPKIDLFASRLNARVQNYVSWKPDPMAKHIDAFTINWAQCTFYAFPPFCLVARCLQKIVQEQATGILVIPLWPSQAYFTTVMNLMVETPILVKATILNLVHPKLNGPHPLHSRLELMVCKLSGIPCLSAIFRQKLPRSSCALGAKVHTDSTKYTSISGYSFVAKGRIIQCVPL